MSPFLCKYFLKNSSKILTFSKGMLTLAKTLIKSSIIAFLFLLTKSEKYKVC